MSEKPKQRESSFYSSRKDVLRTGERERERGRLSERDAEAHTPYGDISYSALIVFLVVLSSYHKSSLTDLITIYLNISILRCARLPS